MFLDAFERKVVLVTGHTGFKGAWLTVWLRRLGAQVVGYSLAPPTSPNLFDACNLANSIDHTIGDIRNADTLKDLFQRYKPDFVFHLAAQPLVRESYRSPHETFDVNVMGTVALLDAVRALQRPCIVVAVTTDKCYENREWVYGYRETDPLGGHDPYSASKAAMEIAVASYRRSFFPPDEIARHGVRLASARAGNVIGGGDWSQDRIVPDAIRALQQGRVLEVRHPTSIRPWQHVLEPLSGYLWLAAKMSTAGGEHLATGWNFGPSPTENYTVGELADAIVKTWGSGGWLSPEKADISHEAGQLRLCIDKARTELGWLPVWDFMTTVGRTVRWYYRLLDTPTMTHTYEACLDDLSAYEDVARRKGLAWVASDVGGSRDLSA